VVLMGVCATVPTLYDSEAELLMEVPAVVPAASAPCDTRPNSAAPANSAVSLVDMLVLIDFILLLLLKYCLKITA
jgi:hypothetical protein